MLLSGRKAVVTGASRGIGAASAKALARHGAAVGVNYFQSEAAAMAVVDEIRAAGGSAVPLKADVRDCRAVQAMAAEAAAKLGEVDTLVVNAAISFPTVPFLEYPWEEFKAKLDGELGAAFFCCRSFAPAMVARRRGCIIGVSSGLSRQPGFGFCAHSTAKAGLDAFMRSLALELGPAGVRVNVVSPGLTVTDATAHVPADRKEMAARMTPLGRLALPDDVAGMVVLLASDEASFVTGQYVSTAGGTLMV